MRRVTHPLRMTDPRSAGVAAEAERYLAAIAVFRAEGHQPRWQPDQGREVLNFSDWGSRQPTASEMEGLCDAVSSGSMPLRSYTLIHRKAILSKHDVDTICKVAGTQPSSAGL